MRPVGVGLAGLGRWGRRYLDVLRQLPEIELRACAEPDSAARRAADPTRAVAGLAELLADSSIRAVIIATPPATHYELARTALESGRNVLVEKPMAETAAEAAELAALAERHGLVLAVGHTPLYAPGFAALRERFAHGSLGQARRAVAVRTSSGPEPRPQSDGVLADLAAHDIAMAISLLGPTLAGCCRPLGNGARRYRLEFESGCRLDGVAAWRRPPHSRRFTLFGTRAVGRLNELPAGPQADSPLGRQCADFIACCRNRTAPLSNARLGAAVVAALEQIQRNVELQAVAGRPQTGRRPCETHRSSI